MKEKEEDEMKEKEEEQGSMGGEGDSGELVKPVGEEEGEGDEVAR